MFEAPSGKTYSTGRDAACLVHLSTRFVAPASHLRRLSTAFPRPSRFAGRDELIARGRCLAGDQAIRVGFTGPAMATNGRLVGSSMPPGPWRAAGGFVR